MKTFIPTFLLLLLASAALGVGFIVTGRSKLRKSCGSTPDENRQKRPKCGTAKCSCWKNSSDH